MENLDQILRDATVKIDRQYFLLPIHGAASIYRERVYCYELYHQMRLLWPRDSEWFLNGEIDKQGYPQYPPNFRLKPDLLVHVPGQAQNFAAIEVKPVVVKSQLDTRLQSFTFLSLRQPVSRWPRSTHAAVERARGNRGVGSSIARCTALPTPAMHVAVARRCRTSSPTTTAP